MGIYIMMGGCNNINFKPLILVCMILLLAGCHSINQESPTNQTPTSGQQPDGSSPAEKEGAVITYTSAVDLIAVPDKIIYYHQGHQTIIAKEDEKFSNVVKMTKARASSVIDATQLYLSNSDIETLKQNYDVLEFAYAKNIAVNWKPPYSNIPDFLFKFDYNTILFPLTGEQEKYILFKPRSPGPLGYMGSADDLLKYLNQ